MWNILKLEGTLVPDLGSPLVIKDPSGPSPMRDQPDDKERFLAKLQEQLTIKGACQAASIPRSTFYTWKSSDKEFREAVEKTLRRCHEDVNDMAESIVIRDIMQGNIGTAKFWLTKCHPKFKTVKEQNAIEKKFLAQFSRFNIQPLGHDDVEY